MKKLLIPYLIANCASAHLLLPIEQALPMSCEYLPVQNVNGYFIKRPMVLV